jgi:putative ABC transport system permease protein
MSSIAQDVRYSIRLLARERRHTLLVCLTMALGIGATTLLFSVVHRVLVHPLPWANADRLIVLNETRGGSPPRFNSFTNAAYLAWQEQAATVESLAAWAPRTVTLAGAGEAERIRIVGGTASLFAALGVRPLVGSLFDAADETAVRGPVVVLSESLWRQRFGGDASALGRTVTFDGQPHTIVGVVADSALYPDQSIRAWVPFRVPPVTGNNLSLFNAVALLRPGITAAQAAAEGTARARHVPDTGMTTTAIFGSNGPVGIGATPLGLALTADVRRALIVLLIAVGLLLLVGTANVASLQLARATTRRREMAIRAALGAAGARAVRQLIVENLLLGVAGGGAGLLLAAALHRVLPSILPADFPRVAELTFDLRAVLFAFAASVCTGLLFGILPALQVRRVNLGEALVEDGAGSTGLSRRSRTADARLAIMAVQIALACMLLVGASLLGRSFVLLLNADRGYNPSGVLTARLALPAAQYTPERRHQVVQRILESVSTVPAVSSAGFTSELPLTPGGSTAAFTLRGPDGPVSVQASPRLISPGAIRALGMRIVAGRGFADSDTGSSPPVALVNHAFARRYLQGSALGVEVPMGIGYMDPGAMASIVGVLDDVRYLSAKDATQPEIYYSFQQLRGRLPVPVVTLLLRTDGDPLTLIPSLRAAVADADRALVADAMAPLTARIQTGLARPRLYAVLIGAFALLAVTLALVGLFGVLSYAVAQRRRELAVRLALGATRADIMRLILRLGGAVTVAGIVLGLGCSAVMARALSSLLYGVTPFDPLSFIGVPLVIVAFSAVASAVPAHRAASADPLRALRG